MKARLRYSWFILIYAFLACLVTPAWAQEITQEKAREMYEGQRGKVINTVAQIQGDIASVCKPIEPINTADPNFCYILQLQCWLDPSGYGPFHVKKCKYEEKIQPDDYTNPSYYYIAGTYYWFCDTSDSSFNTEKTQRAAIWRDRIMRDPSCAYSQH